MKLFPSLIFLSIIFRTPSLASDSDTTRPQFLIGVDVLKNVSMNRFQPGRTGHHFEILLKPWFRKEVHPYFSIGIGKSSNSKLFTNTSLETSGFFIKGGSEFQMFRENRNGIFLGIGLLYSSGRYRARYVLPGNYFAGVVETSDRRENRFALQVNTTFTFPIFRQLEGAVLLNGSLFLQTIPKNSKEKPSWYTPGVGYHRDFPLYPDLIFQLFYNLRKR